MIDGSGGVALISWLIYLYRTMLVPAARSAVGVCARSTMLTRTRSVTLFAYDTRATRPPAGSQRYVYLWMLIHTPPGDRCRTPQPDRCTFRALPALCRPVLAHSTRRFEELARAAGRPRRVGLHSSCSLWLSLSKRSSKSSMPTPMEF